MKVVFVTDNQSEIRIVQELFREKGIESTLSNKTLSQGSEDNPLEILVHQLEVAEADFERAGQIVDNYETTESMPLAISDAEGQFDWPICPQCDELQQAICVG